MDVTDGVGPLSVGVTDGFGPAVDKNVKKKKKSRRAEIELLKHKHGKKRKSGDESLQRRRDADGEIFEKIEVLPVHYFHRGKNIICNNGYKFYRYEG